MGRPADEVVVEDDEVLMLNNLWRQFRLLPPYDSIHSRKRRRWSYFLLALTLYEVISVPLQLAFQEPLGTR